MEEICLYWLGSDEKFDEQRARDGEMWNELWLIEFEVFPCSNSRQPKGREMFSGSKMMGMVSWMFIQVIFPFRVLTNNLHVAFTLNRRERWTFERDLAFEMTWECEGRKLCISWGFSHWHETAVRERERAMNELETGMCLKRMKTSKIQSFSFASSVRAWSECHALSLSLYFSR